MQLVFKATMLQGIDDLHLITDIQQIQVEVIGQSFEHSIMAIIEIKGQAAH